MAWGLPVSFTTKAHLGSRFRSSEPIKKRALRKAGNNINKRDLEASRVVACPCDSSHPQVPTTTRCTTQGRADKVNSQSVELINGDGGEVRVCLWLEASSLQRLLSKVICISLPPAGRPQVGYSHEFLEEVTEHVVCTYPDVCQIGMMVMVTGMAIRFAPKLTLIEDTWVTEPALISWKRKVKRLTHSPLSAQSLPGGEGPQLSLTGQLQG